MHVYLLSQWLVIQHSLLHLLSVRMALRMQYTTLHVVPFMTQGNVFFLSEFTLQKTIHLLSNLCFCLIRPVFPVTLSLPEYLSGIPGGS